MAISQMQVVSVTQCELVRALKAYMFAAGAKLMGVAPKPKIEIPIAIYSKAYTATVYLVMTYGEDVTWVGLKVSNYPSGSGDAFIKVVLPTATDPVMKVSQDIVQTTSKALDAGYGALLLHTFAGPV